ncbi:carcinine hydrolase/isopenicillin-N N-acyltransferase family protein [Brucepastera parasyntrophica]|uniref:carcinine hydrolase/isopenicillin-N N-acyltransferase family protein n=1 Tax=Brucepastera parasyntrophica TaxID=2880008 RepID=UPI003F6E5E9D
MNKKGLFYDGAICPAVTIPFDGEKESLAADFGEPVLSKCATVDEAIAFLEKYNIPHSFSDHIMFADAGGNSAVVEWIDNEMVVRYKRGAYQVATNFFLSKPERGGYPCG